VRALSLVLWGALAQAQAPPSPAPAPLRVPPPPAREIIRELVLANHILSNEGVLDAYGHVSVRDDLNPQRFHLSRSLPPSAVTAADILEYDFDAKPIPANSPNGYSERFIHAEIYRARPDVKAIIHCHAADLIPFSISATRLLPVMHMAGFLGDGIPTFDIRTAAGTTDMLIRTPELGKALAQTLGAKPAALMRGHGAVVIAPGLHEVVGRAYYMNLNAKIQWQAIQLGGQMTYMEPEEARKAGSQDGFERAWDHWKRRAAGAK
jgi:ribulose-5-phosphate 4-epimerase/fuculose-1-phosphate aldolase